MATKAKPKSTTFDGAFKKVAAKPRRWIKTKIKIGAEGREKKRVERGKRFA
jgi:hypothetical protein